MRASTSLAVAAAFAPLTMARFLDFAQPERRDHPMPAEAMPAEAMPAGHALPAELLSGHKKVVSGVSKTEIIIIWANPGAGAETTTINEKVTVTETVTKGGEAVATPAAPQQHTVTVGGPGGLVYQPEELHNVPIGDTVVFEFLSQNHTVSQSGFDKPCALLEGGMDSGFMPNPNNTVSPPPQVAMQVMVDTPLWFYCKQGNHCGQGMVFSINPTAEKTQAKFKEMAIQQNGDGKATPITGGDAAPAPPAESKPAESKPAEAAPAAPEATGVVPGKGTIGGDGSCVCMVSCSAGGFPAQAQGINSFGGMGGAMPYKLDSVV
ncbi:serine-threonine rich protein [Fusarium pseudoanthophilum]|uniref:Serine-threonine rich protein n=1 Tax=Fusarium pseudoanthophilum TaxID=48495 RepID=A0A8H5KMU4_9HYPO|nr:serine-threonine rich protein [Fusarium pseudoanthophilum]